MKRNLFLLCVVTFAVIKTTNAQVNIGSTAPPQAGAALQVTGGGTQGLLGPSVVLTSPASYAPVAGTATNGMLVYHTGGNKLTAGYYFWSNNQWNTTNASSKAISATGNILLATANMGEVNIASPGTADILGYSPTITLNDSANLLITYSACPLPFSKNAPIQGSISLLIDGNIVISSYYSAADAPSFTNPVTDSPLPVIGNYTTSQYLAALPAGPHTFSVRAKCWFNTATFNRNPANGYTGATSTDANAMTTRLSVVILPRN